MRRSSPRINGRAGEHRMKGGNNVAEEELSTVVNNFVENIKKYAMSKKQARAEQAAVAPEGEQKPPKHHHRTK